MACLMPQTHPPMSTHLILAATLTRTLLSTVTRVGKKACPPPTHATPLWPPESGTSLGSQVCTTKTYLTSRLRPLSPTRSSFIYSVFLNPSVRTTTTVCLSARRGPSVPWKMFGFDRASRICRHTSRWPQYYLRTRGRRHRFFRMRSSFDD